MWEPVALCCFTRRSGSLVVGTLGVISSLIGFVMVLFTFMNIRNTVTSILCTHHTASLLGDCGGLSQVAYGMIVLFMIAAVIQCGCSSMMVHGVMTDNHCLMVPFLIKNTVVIVLQIILCTIVVAFLSVTNILIMFMYAYSHGAIIFMSTFFLLTVRAYYYELKHNKLDDHHRLAENCHVENGHSEKL